MAEPVAAQPRRAGDEPPGLLRKRVHLPRGSHQPIPSLLLSAKGPYDRKAAKTTLVSRHVPALARLTRRSNSTTGAMADQ